MASDELDKYVQIKIEGEIFTAEKSILSEFSEYFKAMFSGKFLENRLQTIEIDIINKNDFNRYLDYINTGNLNWTEINSENITRILENATMLQITKFIEAIEVPLIDEWESFGNAAEIFTLSTKYGMCKLRLHLLRLLANCMDIGLDNDFAEMFNDSELDDQQRIYIDEVSYEFLHECLREKQTTGEISFGSSKKKYFESPYRNTKESQGLLEWVCRWTVNYLFDKDAAAVDNVKKIDSLLELCDLKHLRRCDIDQVLDVCKKVTSEIDIEQTSAIFSTIENVINTQKAAIQRSLENIELELFMISFSCKNNYFNKEDEIFTTRCRSILKDGKLSYTFDDINIPFRFDNRDIVLVDSRNDIISVYISESRKFASVNLQTGVQNIFASITDVNYRIITAIMGDGYLAVFGYRSFSCRVSDTQIILSVFDLKTRKWQYETINCYESYCFVSSNMIYFNDSFYFVGSPDDYLGKPYIYRYNPRIGQLEKSEQLCTNYQSRVDEFTILKHNDQLIIFGLYNVTVVNTDMFCNKNANCLKELKLFSNGFKVLGSFSKTDGRLYVICSYVGSSSYYTGLCIADLHVNCLRLKEGLMEDVGSIREVYNDHDCQSKEWNSSLSRYRVKNATCLVTNTIIHL